MFEVSFEVGWFDCDANRHLKNTAFLEYAIESRFRYFHENEFPASAFAKHQITPVVVKDEITYKRELHLLDKFKVQFLCAGVNAAGTRNLVVNRIVKADGELAAEVCLMIVWFDLAERKVRVPPPELAAAVAALARTEDYGVL
jgi:acyl-CoA thioester hydrolase